MCNSRRNKPQSGVTLIELVVAIAVLSVALSGVLKMFELINRGSTDPLVRKQALAIAESLLQEVQQQAFTLCDPDDANASIALAATDCNSLDQNAGGAALAGPIPNTESRYSQTDPLDNVADYAGFTMPDASCAGICNPGDATPLPNFAGYAASVTVTRAGAAAPFAAAPLDAVLRVQVRVTGPAATEVNLTGYRLRYAPN